MAELCVIGYLMGTRITYFVVVGDLGPQIIAKLFNLNHSDSLRWDSLNPLKSITILVLLKIEINVNFNQLSEHLQW